MTLPKGASPIVSAKPALVLASESPRRVALLRQAGLEPDAIIPARLDESVLKNEMPKAHAERLARAKALAVAASADPSRSNFVLAADTVVACGRRVLPKAEDDAGVRTCLRLLSGRRHRVLTAVALIAPDGTLRTRLCTTLVAFKRLAANEVEDYVASREGVGKAGGYAIQGRAEIFVRQIIGSHSNVVGLPLFETVALLKGAGYGVP